MVISGLCSSEEKITALNNKIVKNEESIKITNHNERTCKNINVKKRILEASLSFVCDHGWTHQSIGYGAESLNMPSTAHGMFPNGGVELLHHFYEKCNDELVQLMQKDISSGDVFDFIEFAVRERLQMNEPYLSRWPQAMALLALPNNMGRSFQYLSSLIDDICYHAGDRSVDFQWYTHRMATAIIYQSTEIYMIQDKSIGHGSTWDFLKRRIADAERIQKGSGQTSKIMDKTTDIANATVLTVRNLLNLN